MAQPKGTKNSKFFCMLVFFGLFCPEIWATKVHIEETASGEFRLMRDGTPYVIKGAGGKSHLKTLVEMGGNSIRLWAAGSMDTVVDGQSLADRCQALGISITVGLWVGHERHGFNYSNETQVKHQRESIRRQVRKYKDHPAVLMWGLGNEMEGPTSTTGDPKVWKELNVLAKLVKEEDPSHPVMTVIAGASANKVQGIMTHYPEIDVLGVNAYSEASRVAGALKKVKWKKPYILSEFGPVGHWEVAKTPWGAPIEPSSREKAMSYYVAQKITSEEHSDICIGTYCFIWGHKQETTSTWFGMFLESGEKLPQVDAMARQWTGAWPTNRCPKVESFESDLKRAVVKAGSLHKVRSNVADPEGDPMTWSWRLMAESQSTRIGGDAEPVPPEFRGLVTKKAEGEAEVKAPEAKGGYRLFMVVRDGKGSASVENFCFRVE